MSNSREENFPSYLKEDSRLSIVADMRAADVLLKFYRDKCKKLTGRLKHSKMSHYIDVKILQARITELEETKGGQE